MVLMLQMKLPFPIINLFLIVLYSVMGTETVKFGDAFSKEKTRKGSFDIYDFYNTKTRVNSFSRVRVDNKTNDPYWHVKRYRMDILFRVRAEYEDGGETFIFHYWINNLPISYNRYSRNRALVMNYVATIFNIDYPFMRIRSITEERIIINDNMYLIKIRDQIRSDLKEENASEAIAKLNGIT